MVKKNKNRVRIEVVSDGGKLKFLRTRTFGLRTVHNTLGEARK